MRRFLKIEVMSQMQAVAAARRLDAKTAILSITAPKQGLPEFEESRWLLGVFRLCFYDIATELPGMAAPKQKDFDGLREFVDGMQKKEVELYIVHCAAGISRSAGLAAALGEYLGVDAHVFGNPAYFPNRLVYRLAKNEFGIPEDVKYYEEVFREQTEPAEKERRAFPWSRRKAKSSVPAKGGSGSSAETGKESAETTGGRGLVKGRELPAADANLPYRKNPRKTVRKIVRLTERGKSVPEIAKKTGISEELTEKIVRLVLTHPNATPDDILTKMGM